VAFYLGIDGGGSKTTCAVGDEKSVLARATAGPSNIVRVGEARARESLHACVQSACEIAAVDLTQIACTCVGAAGAARPEVASAVRQALAEILFSPIEVLGDMQIALEAAFAGAPGVIVIAGTGSIAYGRNADGTEARAGGHGGATSDEGSGHWIGKQAVVALIASEKNSGGQKQGHGHAAGGLSETFITGLQRAWGVESIGDLIRKATSDGAADFSLLFPAVLSAAEAGDKSACEILAQAGLELGKLATEVIRPLFGEPEVLRSSGANASPHGAQVVPLAMVGGVFRHAPIVREVFYNQIRECDRRVAVSLEVVDPIEGALRVARRSAGKPASP
jgi:glucosamine kinase